MALDQALATVVTPIISFILGSFGGAFLKNRRGSKIYRYSTSKEHEADLEKIVNSASGSKRVFYASVGMADSFVPWIKRLYNDAAKPPPIKEIVVKRISDGLARRLEAAGFVEPGFAEHLNRQMSELMADKVIKNLNTKIIVFITESLPPFQGYLFNGHGLTNHWQVNRSGFLDAKTPLEKHNENFLPERYESELQYFDPLTNVRSS